MKISFLPVLAILLLLASPARGGERPYVEGEILVKYRAHVAAAAREDENRRLGAQRIRTMRRLGVQHLRLPAGMGVADAVRLYRENPDVEYAEPNYIVRPAQTVPGDPDFFRQWYLHNTGQVFFGSSLSGTADADINAPEAWDLQTGTGTVVVAVIDTGVDYTHPDLDLNMWTNVGEANCSDGVDDDGNGFVDDCMGWDFVNGDNDPRDDYSPNGHGTLAAGIIGAEGDNGMGIAGINWSVQIMPLKFIPSAGDGNIALEAEAIDYAVQMGADVINASYGFPEFCDYENPQSGSNTERLAIEAAQAAGVLFVASAGNSGCDNDRAPFFPASYDDLDNIISVASSDYDDLFSSFSNFGVNSVHLAAPGEQIYSTLWSPLVPEYGFESGTSFSAPMVSGAAALLMAQNPGVGYSVVKGAMLSSVDPMGYDVITGGRLNLFGAISTDVVSPTPFPPTGLNASAASTSEVNLAWSDNSSNETAFELERNAGSGFSLIASLPADTSSHPDTGLSEATSYTYRVRAVNGGNASDYSNQAGIVTLPNAPTGLAAAAVSSSRIDLAWTDNSSGEDGVRIERAPEGGAFTQVAQTGANAVAYSDTGLSAASTYSYRVRAFTSGGNSAYSNQAAATTDAAAADGGGGGGGCFIATAAYGSYLAPEVEVLKEFRDRHLLTNGPGRAFVSFYYRVSPDMARYISRHPALRGAARAALTPVVYAVKYPGAALALVVCGAAIFVYYRKGRGGKRR